MKKKWCAFLLFFLLCLTFGLKAQTCYKVVAYTPQWLNDNVIDYTKLTHICYAFNLANNDGTLQAMPDVAKLNRIVRAAHAANVKVLISIGGWNVGSPNNAPFESISTNSTYLNTFINACAGLMTTYNLDGVDLDWEFPTTGERWDALMVPLAAKLHSMDKLMAAAVIPKASYNNVSMLDILNSMSYDCACPTTSPYLKAVKDMNYWIVRGVPRDKIVLGVTFEVAQDRNCTLNTQKADLVKSLRLGGMMIWNLNASPSDLPCIYNALGNVCGQTLFNLSVTATNGTVTKNPIQSSYTFGTAVTLTATPNAGYVFSNWSGALTGTTNPASITMDGSKSVSAIFTASPGTTTSFEAENGTFGGGSVIQNATAASNGKVIGTLNNIGAYSQIGSINGGTGGIASLTIRYANGYTDNRSLGLYVNDIRVQQVVFATTGGWNTFADKTGVNVTLNAGTSNTIKLQCDASDVAAADIDKYSVTVSSINVAVTGVTVSPTTASVYIGTTTSLTAAVLPSNATNKTVSWTSSNSSVATVNSSGVVTGVAAGSATITGTTQDGGKTATCAVTVYSGAGTNLISNGDFSGGLTGWVFNTTGATASASVSNGEAVINITTAGASSYQPQLVHDGFALLNGQSYTVSFKAKAASSRNIVVFISTGPASDWTEFLNETVALTTTMQTFQYSFTANITDNNARIDFNCGINNANVIIDDVVIITTQAPPTYALTVNSGIGSGNYSAGTVVNIYAHTAPSGKVFDKWTGSTAIADVNSAVTTIDMPTSATSVTAIYKDGTYTDVRPVDKYGRLQVKGNKIVGENGQVARLFGESLCFTAYNGEKYYNASVVNWLVKDWKIDVIRASMSVDMAPGWINNKTAQYEYVEAVVNAAIANGIYVLVDFHTEKLLTNEAKEFYGYMAQKYGQYPNMIWEPFNEPIDQTWAQLTTYHNEVRTVIRQYSQNLIVAGSGSWSTNIDQAADAPLPDDNTAYTLHFYAGTHKASLRTKAENALNKGIALFITEWGTSTADGGKNMIVYEAESNVWIDWALAHDISMLNWHIMNWVEASCALKEGVSTTGGWNPSTDLTPSGIYIRNKIISMNGSKYKVISGIDKFSALDCKVYPNPVEGMFTLMVGELNKNTFAEIYDMDGRKVFQKQIESQQTLIIHNLKSGTYVLLVKNDKGIAQEKLIVK